MKYWKKRLLTGMSAIILAFSLTACESYDEWEARTEREKTEQSATYIDTGDKSSGPNLADYVNSGVEEAKQSGLYKDTDYSGIRADGEDAGPGQNPDKSGQSNIDVDTKQDTNPGQNPDKSGQSNIDVDTKQDTNPGQNPDKSGQEWEEILKYLAELEYEGEPYVYVNDNVPYFTEDDYELTDAFEYYSELDNLGRAGQAFALLNESLMPKYSEERDDISSVKPTGWVQVKYDGIGSGGWLYNRCHLIAWSLAGENANECNLMTGTRYFNVEGMLPFEMQALEYLDDNPNNHVLYRATPVYEEDNLLADGLLLEAYSMEDDGELSFCAYLFNIQPGIVIDYATGESYMED